MILWFVGSIIAGSILGIFFSSIYRKVVPCGWSNRYWAGMAQNIHGLFRGAESRFWSYYKSIILDTCRYASRQLAGVLLALLPLTILLITLGPVLQSSWNRNATLAITPKDAGAIIFPQINLNGSLADRESSLEELTSQQHVVVMLRGGYQLTLLDGATSYALYPIGSLAGTLLKLLGFTAIPVDPAMLAEHEIIIVRGFKNDRNPLWPYFNDPEFLFFLSFSIVSVTFMLGHKDTGDPEKQSDFTLELSDYALTWVATHFAGTMRSLGNWESRIMARRMKMIDIKEPVFVSGLARSGTTILLETLAMAEGFATHRYRDFPGIMMPVFWNWFINLFSTRQVPVERPHKDRIKITMESPDAFEEPIWQYFFPFLHDQTTLQRMDEEISNPAFEKFYKEHIQKILLIRKGSKYLSKGNYNLSRIEYISSIFCDAKFLVPVRHPLSQIESLVRQHQIFTDYAAQNPHVSEYLESAGHYEFGPQRRPVCLTREGGERIVRAWENGKDHLGYAIQWAEIYRFVAELLGRRPKLSDRIMVIRYEDLCAAPDAEIEKILTFADMQKNESLGEAVRHIKPPSAIRSLPEEHIQSCWQEVEEVARLYGYSINQPETGIFSQDSLKITSGNKTI